MISLTKEQEDKENLMVKHVICALVLIAGLGLGAHAHAGTTAIVVGGVNTCVTMDGATTPGTYARGTTCDGSATQLWNTQTISFNGISPSARATVRFVNVLSGLCLDNAVGSNAGVVQNTCSNSPSQQWVISEPGVFVPDASGTTRFWSRSIGTQSGNCLDGSLYPPTQSPYRNVNTTTCASVASQDWYLDAP